MDECAWVPFSPSDDYVLLVNNKPSHDIPCNGPFSYSHPQRCRQWPGADSEVIEVHCIPTKLNDD